MKKLLKVHLLEYWHAGTGAGLGPVADAETQKDRNGLPFLPGKTLRGLIRDAVEMVEELGSAHEVAPGTAERVFGRRAGKHGATSEGILRFSNAEIDKEIGDWVNQSENGHELAGALFENISATAVDRKSGLVKDSSLRSIEFALPICLTATVHGPDDESWVNAIRSSLPLIRGVGTSRRRGFGRANITLEEVQ